MKKMFSCSSSQVAVESWNKHDQKLLEAVEKGDVVRVASLAARKTARPTKLNALGQSAFHIAASQGLTECLSLLLNHGAEVNQKNDDGSSALHLATIACQPQCVKVLLQHGANEDCVDGQNRTPLHWAAHSGCASSVLLLCDHEAFLDVADNSGQTPLMIAAQGNHAAICSQLLQRGAKVDLADKDGKTALILACEKGSTELAQLLLSHGADVALADGAGHDALNHATRAQSRPLQRLLRRALNKKKRREIRAARQSSSKTQVVGGNVLASSDSSLTLQSEGTTEDDGDVSEDLDAEEWRCRYEDEQARVQQLKQQLASKTQECQAMAKGCRAMRERVWDQVQELDQLLPERRNQASAMPCLNYSQDATEEDYYLNLLTEQVQELKRSQQETGKGGRARLKWPGEEEEEKKRHEEELKRLRGEVAAALEEKASALRRVQEMEGHLENMRAVLAVYETKKRTQSETLEELQARVTELDRDNQRLRELLAQQQDEQGSPDRARSRPASGEELEQLLSWMQGECAQLDKEKGMVLAKNKGLKWEVEEALRGKLHLEVVPAGAVRKSLAAWEKMVVGLERLLAKTAATNTSFLERARPLQATISAPPCEDPPAGAVNGTAVSPTQERSNGFSHHEEENHIFGDKAKLLSEPEKGRLDKAQDQDGTSRPLWLRPRNSLVEAKKRARRRSSDLEKEVLDLKQNNGSLLHELTQLGKEREKLQEELRSLCERPQGDGAPGADPETVVEELRQKVALLSQELLAEKEETKKLWLRLEAQRKEIVLLRDGFLQQMGEAEGTGGHSLGPCILKELHWKLDSLVKKHNEALQLVSEMEEDCQAPATPCKSPAHANGHQEMENAKDDLPVGPWRLATELERDLGEAKEALRAVRVGLGSRGQETAKLSKLLESLAGKTAKLRAEEEAALRKHDKAQRDLALQAEALEEELRALEKRYEEAVKESARWEEATMAERQKSQELLANAAEQEREAGVLRDKATQLQHMVEKLNERAEELARACQDKEGKIKKLLEETEKLSAEVLSFRSQNAQLQLQMEVQQKNHQDIVAVYRTHLLNAAQFPLQPPPVPAAQLACGHQLSNSQYPSMLSDVGRRWVATLPWQLRVGPASWKQ
ncbi:ankyrin repeat domain-containing protein 35 isoform X1 [Alligator mississippiensis]|uniref:ankyrin repeat domain-containing protein 35 isoform X1 n=1 Tax=Alligator mississippiensis TaxID=8496 RepID=UPI0006EC8122|nr:ankyrin repeat domain-containing protein 35 isoform X1 [Alligator mississippiensis]